MLIKLSVVPPQGLPQFIHTSRKKNGFLISETFFIIINGREKKTFTIIVFLKYIKNEKEN